MSKDVDRRDVMLSDGHGRGGMTIPLSADSGLRRDLRDHKGSKTAPFRPQFLRSPEGKSRD